MVQYTWGWVTATCRRDWTAGPSEIWSPTSKMYGSNYEAPRPWGADLCTLFVGQFPKSFVWKESLVFFLMLLAHTVKTIQRSRQTDRRADWLTGWLTDWLIWYHDPILFPLTRRFCFLLRVPGVCTRPEKPVAAQEAKELMKALLLGSSAPARHRGPKGPKGPKRFLRSMVIYHFLEIKVIN